MSAFRVGTSKVGGTDLLGGATTGGPPSRVKSVGSNTSGSSGTTIAVTVPAGGAAAGNHLLIGLAWSGATSVTLSSVTDSRGNTYQTDRAQAASGANGAIVSALIGTALQSGDTITATLSAAATHRLMTVDEITGMPTSSWLDQATSATGTSTTPSSGSVTTTSANEYLFAVASIDTATANTYAPDGSWGEDYELHTTSKGIEVAHQTATSTGSFTASGVLGSSVLWSQLVATYKSSGSGPSTHSKSGAFLAGSALVGPDVFEATDSGTFSATTTATGPDAYTATETGATAAGTRLTGADAFTSAETGATVAGTVARGPDVYEAAETGTATSTARAAGADNETLSRQGAATSTTRPVGTDVYEAADTGTFTADTVAAGTSEKTTGAATYEKTGAFTTGAALTGTDTFEATETGAATTSAVAAGASVELPTIVATPATLTFDWALV